MFTKSYIWIIRLFCLLLIFSFYSSKAFSYDFAGGTGVPDNPYQIATAEQLISIGDDPNLASMDFILTADINLSGFLFSKAIIPRFYGTFDGNDLTIRGLKIEFGKRDDIGLFGRLFTEAKIINLGIEDVNIIYEIEEQYRDDWGYCIGGLAGGNEGTVTNCYSTGYVSGWWCVGGLIGFNSGRITNCFSNGIVTGDSVVGGLVGTSGGCIFTNCYSSSTVTGGGAIGGLIGYSESDMLNNCYSTGTVTGTGDGVGGLIGWSYYGSLANSYSIGTVIGYTDDVGGLLGHNSYMTLSDCYWDMDTSGQANSFGGIGKTTIEMKQKATFVNWDFIDVWGIAENQTYPFLRSCAAGDLNGDCRVDFKDYTIMANHWLEN